MAYTELVAVLLVTTMAVKLSAEFNVNITPSPVAMVTNGSMLWLTCTFDLEGGTLGQLLWRYQDGGIAGSVTPTASPPCSTFSHESYILDCNQLESNEVRLGIRDPGHGDTYNCSVYLSNYTLIGPVSTQVFVVVPVASIELQPSAQPFLDLTENLTTTLTCVTSNCRPFASVFWSVGGVNYTSYSVSTVQSVPGDLYSTNSTLTFIPQRHMTRQILACYASNTDVQILATQRPVLNVRHRPEISIFPADDPYVVTEGQTNVTLRCVVTSANPSLTSLGWKKADTTVANIGVFKFPAITAEHAGVYTCSAFNGVGIASTISVTLTILTSPTSPNIVGFTEVTSSTLTVEWTPNAQGDMASVFNITHGCRGCAMIESSSVNLTKKAIYSSTLTNLVPQSQYYVNITAINMAGPSSPLELIVSTPADTCRFPLEVTSPSSTALLVVGVILITISVAVLGISIFVYRKSSSFSRSKSRKENPTKPVTFSNVQQSTEDTQQESVNERADYQELDPSDINRPSPYECLPEGKGEGTENSRDHYESVKVHTTHDYLQLVHDKDSSRYANT